MKLRAIPKIGTRGRQWLIVNELGGLYDEWIGTQASADKHAEEMQKLVDAKNAEADAASKTVD
jgi:hypothetical protein